ncbi:MAG: hypothetical protein ACUVUC_15770, partial [Thermoguttaceae bacterium]
MKTFMSLAAAWGLALGGLCTQALAQKGMGDLTGVARQAVGPELVTLSGKLLEIKTGPCENTTGRSPIGTHILLESRDGQRLNVHLGPAAAVADIVAGLKPGQQVTAKAFRTEKMPEGHYVAQSLTVGSSTVLLRDESLRPAWAGGRPGGGFGRVWGAGAP